MLFVMWFFTMPRCRLKISIAFNAASGHASSHYAPYFISGFSAEEYWDLTEQLFTTVEETT